MSVFQQLGQALAASGWRFDPADEAFYHRHGILLDYGELMALVPGTTECEFAAWAKDRAELRAKRPQYIVGGRIVCSVAYTIESGEWLIVWFDRGGNDLNGRVVHSDPQRRIVTARPGEVIVFQGQRHRVVSLEPYRQNWLTAEDRQRHSRQPAHSPF